MSHNIIKVDNLFLWKMNKLSITSFPVIVLAGIWLCPVYCEIDQIIHLTKLTGNDVFPFCMVMKLDVRQHSYIFSAHFGANNRPLCILNI